MLVTIWHWLVYFTLLADFPKVSFFNDGTLCSSVVTDDDMADGLTFVIFLLIIFCTHNAVPNGNYSF